jgi:hypothetical protein
MKKAARRAEWQGEFAADFSGSATCIAPTGFFERRGVGAMMELAPAGSPSSLLVRPLSVFKQESSRYEGNIHGAVRPLNSRA